MDPRMMGMQPAASQAGNPLHISWTNNQVPPNVLNAENILEYFCELSNPFYERTCNNEELRMQRLPIERLGSMVGVQYVLYKAEPPLFVVRKRNRSIAGEITPLADYYIIGGVVYQAPNLSAVVTSRILAATLSLRDAFLEALSYSNYHPSRGYWWEFGKQSSGVVSGSEKKKEESKKVHARTTLFQKERVDMLLAQLSEHFPPSDSQKDRIPNIETQDDLKSEAGSSIAATESQKRPATTGSDHQNEIKRARMEPS